MRRAIVFVVAAVSVVSLGGCKKSSHASAAKSSASTSTTVSASSGTTATTAAPSSATSQPANSEPKLLADICSMLDPSTITDVLGVSAEPTRSIAGEGDSNGGCLYGHLTSGGSLETTAFTGSNLALAKIRWKAAFPPVSGVGNAAYSRGVVPIGNTKNVVLYVDYGDFGMEFAAGAPNATVAQTVKVAQALK
jgi:hypothetical protein